MLLTSKGGRHLFFRRKTILVIIWYYVSTCILHESCYANAKSTNVPKCVYHFACWVISHAFLIFTQNGRYSLKRFFMDYIRVSNSFDPYQDQRIVGSALGSNCLQTKVIGRRHQQANS